MKALLALILFTLPLSAVELRGAVRGGVVAGAASDAVGTIELDARLGSWSVAPAYEVIRGGYGLYAVHADIRHIFRTGQNKLWIGAGPTWLRSNSPSSQTTWNVDAGIELGTGAWKPFVAARYYRFRLPVFRDVLEGGGAVLSVGISRRLTSPRPSA